MAAFHPEDLQDNKGEQMKSRVPKRALGQGDSDRDTFVVREIDVACLPETRVVPETGTTVSHC